MGEISSVEQEASDLMTKFRFLSAGELIDAEPVVWRVLDVIPKKGLVVMWGAAGSGKSFAAYELSAAIARGVKFHGKRVKRGMVLYIAAEGNLSTRTKAYLRENNLDVSELDGLKVLPRSVNMLNPNVDMHDLMDSIDDAILGSELALVVVDTLNRVMPGGNENGSEDMGAVIANAKRIEDKYGCAVMFIHHSGKDESKGTRGHSSLKGAMDAEISITRADDIRTFGIGKQKDGADYYSLFNFKLRTVDLGAMSEIDTDAEWHERLTSCVIEVTDDLPKTAPAAKNRNFFQEAKVESKDGSKEDIRNRFYERHPGNADAKRVAFNREWGKYMNELKKVGNE